MSATILDQPIRASAVALVVALFASFAAPLAAHGDLHKRIAKVTRQIAKAPTDAALYLTRGELHRLHRDWPAARKDYVRARRLGAAKLRDLDFHEGRMEVQAGQPMIALRFLHRHLRLQPDSVPARLWRARALAVMGRNQRALRDYDVVIRVSTRPDPDRYLERARVQLAAGVEVGVVLAGLDAGIAKMGPLVSVQGFALELERRSGAFAAALHRIDHTLPTLPLKSPWLLWRGRVLEQMGRPEAAYQAYAMARRELLAARRPNPMQRALDAQLGAAIDRLDATRLRKSDTR